VHLELREMEIGLQSKEHARGKNCGIIGALTFIRCINFLSGDEEV